DGAHGVHAGRRRRPRFRWVRSWPLPDPADPWRGDALAAAALAAIAVFPPADGAGRAPSALTRQAPQRDSRMQWVIYGANGYTGRLIAQQARARGLSPILAGRSDAVAPLAQ